MIKNRKILQLEGVVNVKNLTSLTLKDVTENISDCCKSWIDQFSFIGPKFIADRIVAMKGLRTIIKTIVGIFIKPHIIKSKNIYIFQGLRNSDYMEVFDAESVIIVGSYREREFAARHGFAFIWSFPIQSSIHSKLIRNWDYPVIKQLKYWISSLSDFNSVIIFLQEDTQPLGTFFVHLGRLLPSTIKTVCIQHGFFLKYYYPIRNDGELADINFVWASSQSEVIRCDKSKIFEIGLSYTASAKTAENLYVILVGTGMMGSGTRTYERSIDAYNKIYLALKHDWGIKVFYRPHPNESIKPVLIENLKTKFQLVSEPNKLSQLNGPQAIFVGVESSLLFEAGVAGHLVARLKLDESVPYFHFDFEFEEYDIDELIQWIKFIANDKKFFPVRPVEVVTPQERFKLALVESGLTN